MRSEIYENGVLVGTVEVDDPPADLAAPPDASEIEAARVSLAASTTVLQTKTRALALDDLRADQIAALSPET